MAIQVLRVLFSPHITDFESGHFRPILPEFLEALALSVEVSCAAEVEMLLPLGRLLAGGTSRNRWLRQQGAD